MSPPVPAVLRASLGGAMHGAGRMSPCFGASSCPKVNFSKQLCEGKDTAWPGADGTLPGRLAPLAHLSPPRRGCQGGDMCCQCPTNTGRWLKPSPCTQDSSRGSCPRAGGCSAGPAPFPSPWDAPRLAQPTANHSGSPARVSLRSVPPRPSPVGARCCQGSCTEGQWDGVGRETRR